MLYAKKVRLSLALLTGRVVQIVGVGRETSTPESIDTQTITEEQINNTKTRCNAQS